MPDVGVARADQIAGRGRPPFGRRQADARRLRELEHEHRQRPRRVEGAALDREHGGQVAVDERAKLDRRRIHPGPVASVLSISALLLTPKLRVGWSQIDRLDRLRRRRLRRLWRASTDVPRRDPVRRVVVGEDPRAGGFELTPKSYRAVRPGRQRLGVERRRRALASSPGEATKRRPQLCARRLVQGRERPGRGGRRCTASPARPARRGSRRSRAPSAARDPTADDRLRQPLGEAARGRHADPQPGERARADPDRDRLDGSPAAGRRRPTRRSRQAARGRGRAVRRLAGSTARSNSTASPRGRRHRRRRGVAVSKPTIGPEHGSRDHDLAGVAARVPELDPRGDANDHSHRGRDASAPRRSPGHSTKAIASAVR